MGKITLGSHTVKSHGWKVAREHLMDWIILVLLGIVIIVLNIMEPFRRYIGPDMLTDLTFPLYKDTIPIWAVPVSPLVSKEIISLCLSSSQESSANVADYICV